MGDKLKNRVAIVTGSGRQIGKEIALHLAGEGAIVITNDIIFESAEATANEIKATGGEALACPCDVSNFEDAGKLIKTAIDNFGKLDILINNAGQVRHQLLSEMTEQDWDNIIKTCLKSTFNCTRHAVEPMVEQKYGRIINASSGARLGAWGQAHYSAAKAGVVALTVTTCWEFWRHGITCNAYCPFGTSIAVPSEARNFIPEQMREAGILSEKDSSVLLSAPPGPEYIAPFITYLCTDKANDITGQIFFISGRRVARYNDGGDELNFILRGEEGKWTLDELAEQVPKILMEGYINPLKSSPRCWDEKAREK